MPDTPGSLKRHAASAACLMLFSVTTARAQAPPAPPPTPDFFTRYDFHLAANGMAFDDPRFSWDAHFGGDVDIVDYVAGRATILIDYEAVLGDEFRPFDPNQAYYTLEASGSYRMGATELAGVFHHVSRHLSDRPKQFSVAWNVLGGRVLRRVSVAGVTIDGRVGGGWAIRHSYADYTWTGDLDVIVRRTVSPRVGVFAHGFAEIVGVDGTIPERTTQRGGRLEAGVRLTGRAGAVELFGGFERRIDADPIDRVPREWAVAGFRLLNK